MHDQMLVAINGVDRNQNFAWVTTRADLLYLDPHNFLPSLP